MEKLVFIVILSAGVYYYNHPTEFEMLRTEASLKAGQAVSEAQQKTNDSLIGVVKPITPQP